ncbi:MAG: SRPBCC family protein [Rhodospirillales bacterium]|nr:SRPBCC family protein [Alphaproteobacteria bacterium]MCB9977531.1 SRPBCC family protein [Rhodospirillales bacterium]
MSIFFLILGVVVIGLAIFINAQDNQFKLSRSTVIPAPTGKVFEQVNNLKNWNAWSPWARMDPNAKNSFEGPEAGVGAVMGWAGNKNVGEGKMTIIESRPDELVKFKLEFYKPFKGTNQAEFTFRPEGSGTHVTWSMTGDKNFIAKAMHLVMDCEKMVGGQFEDGFKNLDEVLKKAA